MAINWNLYNFNSRSYQVVMQDYGLQFEILQSVVQHDAVGNRRIKYF
jgi:hypothetical protein